MFFWVEYGGVVCFFLFMLGVHFGCMDVLKDVKGVETWSFLLEVAARGWRR